MRNVVVVSAGLSEAATSKLLGDRIAAALASQVGARGEELGVSHVELRTLALPMATTLTTGGIPTPELEAAKRQVTDADGLIVVTPVYAASYSGLFKLFFDLLEKGSLDGMPVLLAATAGTARHSLMIDHALRPLFAYAHAVAVPTGVFAATEDFGGGETSDEDPAGPLTKRIARAAAELAQLVVATPTAVAGFTQAPDRPAAPADDAPRTVGLGPVTPFSQLLKGHSGTL